MEVTEALGPWWVYVIASFAGFVSFRDVFDWSDTCKRTALKLLMHQATSAFAGLLAYHLTIVALGSVQLEKATRASFLALSVGIVAWRGAKGLQWIADWWEKRNGAGPTGK